MHSIREVTIYWKPGTSDIAVGPFPEPHNDYKPFHFTWGACNGEVHTDDYKERQLHVFIAFNHIVVRDGVPIDAAHREFCKVKEYVDGLADDVPGSHYRREVGLDAELLSSPSATHTIQ